MHHDQWNKVAEEVNFNLEIDVGRFRENIPFDSKVLDFGCGYGRVSNLLLNSGYRRIVGIDSSANMIERGKREFPELRLDILAEEGLPYPDNSFDAIVACGVFTCITSQKIRGSHMNELYRILKPEGLLHMVEFCSEPSNLFTASIGVPMLHSTPPELKELAGMLQVVSEEVKNTNTMGGNKASCYSLFARKSLNKLSKKDAVSRASS
jgi:ubiquinone/menaquinone biosynthesis C-methylase UbiE